MLKLQKIFILSIGKETFRQTHFRIFNVILKKNKFAKLRRCASRGKGGDNMFPNPEGGGGVV